jgi:rhodanese-related sulfurtransferase
MRNQNRKKQKQERPALSPAVWIAGAAVLILIVAGVLFLGKIAPTAAVELPVEVDVAQAAALRQAGAFVLDVRTLEEWNQTHIPDATLIPLDELPGRLAEVPADQEIVVVCRSGNRSQQGRDILLDAGYTRVTSMAGGINEWRAQGYPAEAGK